MRCPTVKQLAAAFGPAERTMCCKRCGHAPGSCFACGAAPDERIGQTEIRWSTACPDDTRAKLRTEIAEIKRRRASRIGPRAARTAWERRGERALAAPDTAPNTVRRARDPWTVRVYYRSMGDEILCFDVQGLTADESMALDAECAQVTRRDGRANVAHPPLRSDAIDAERWRGRNPAPPIRHGARLVTLPSQRTEPVEVTHEDDAPGTPSAPSAGEPTPAVQAPAPTNELPASEPGLALVPEAFTCRRCEALRATIARRGLTSDLDRTLFAACNSVLYGSDSERAQARVLLAKHAPHVATLESPERAAERAA